VLLDVLMGNIADFRILRPEWLLGPFSLFILLHVGFPGLEICFGPDKHRIGFNNNKI
jgi:hypothetical protein